MDEGSYVLQELLTWPALQLLLRRRKRLKSRRVILLGGVAGMGQKYCAPGLAGAACTICLSVRHRSSSRDRAFAAGVLSSNLVAQGKHSTMRNNRPLMDEVETSLHGLGTVSWSQRI